MEIHMNINIYSNIYVSILLFLRYRNQFGISSDGGVGDWASRDFQRSELDSTDSELQLWGRCQIGSAGLTQSSFITFLTFTISSTLWLMGTKINK